MAARSKLVAVVGLAAAVLAAAAAVLPAQEVRVLGGEGTIVVAEPDGPAVDGPIDAPVELEAVKGVPGHHPPRSGPKRPEQPDGEKDKKDNKGNEKEKKPGEKEGEKKDEEKGDSSKPVKRPTEPTEPPDPKELELKPDQEGKVRLNFRGQSWPDVLQWLADVSQLSLDWLEVPDGYLNLTTQRSYTLDEARDLINRHLLARGFTLLRNGEILSVVKIENLNPSMVPRVEPEELEGRDPHEFVKVSFTLDWMMADRAVEELKPMMSSHAKLTPLTATNRMEAIDVVINLRDVHTLLTREQSAGVREGLLHEFPLKYTRASEVREQLAELLGVESSSGPPRPMTPQQMQQAQEQAKRMAEMLKQQGKKPGAPPKPKTAAKICLVANQRRNSILALAPPDKLAIIEQAIKIIDVPSDHAHSLLRNKDRMQVYFLESIEPAPLIKTLADHMTIRALVEKLDGGGRRAEVIRLQTLGAESVARIVDFMMGGPVQ